MKHAHEQTSKSKCQWHRTAFEWNIRKAGQTARRTATVTMIGIEPCQSHPQSQATARAMLQCRPFVD